MIIVNKCTRAGAQLAAPGTSPPVGRRSRFPPQADWPEILDRDASQFAPNIQVDGQAQLVLRHAHFTGAGGAILRLLKRGASGLAERDVKTERVNVREQRGEVRRECVLLAQQ